jgi:hypothetical protein
MTSTMLRALTWGTITGAVVSALLLASGEPGLPDLSRLHPGDAIPRSSARPRAARPAKPERAAPAQPSAPVNAPTQRHAPAVP